ncbi:serine hydrolase [Candidatus Atelocyanobacterium thalassae]|uniref:Beta-lactamase class A catalytic domain-containing protein n=1 Tax=cyanobacterium endosymbiont of Braarudosphaera bigelowii TaxID=1285375 RepID=A0ABN6K2D0_9CHRO|nr:serine hydrolase [Candidatus Atelocyanobacterium thalassa]BDA39425.1 hypothetical protein CPARK_000026400 [cyanobacterium endosymbiont of Braarudosphaera bigelowii]
MKLQIKKVFMNHAKYRKLIAKLSSNILSKIFIYIIRLSIIGAGISIAIGTTLPILNSKYKTSFYSTKKFNNNLLSSKELLNNSNEKFKPQELIILKKQLEDINIKYPDVQPKAWFFDLDSNTYVNFNGTKSISAASTIKIPVLIAFFEKVDAGDISLDQMITMDKEMIVSGSGNMQYMQAGKQFTALEIARKMIIISDNTATELLVRQIGGKFFLNERFKKWGMKQTVINNPLPDLNGTNRTSPEDLTKLLLRIERGDLISLRSRDRFLNIMRETKTKTLLPKGLEKNASIAHKTGDIGTIIADAGIIDMPTGKRYIGAIFVERSYDDPAGRELIQKFSKAIYQYLKSY